jgi:hypothetical protein
LHHDLALQPAGAQSKRTVQPVSFRVLKFVSKGLSAYLTLASSITSINLWHTNARLETLVPPHRCPTKTRATESAMSLHCEHCGAAMRLLTDVPDVGTGRGVRYYACFRCDHIHMRPIDWRREHLLTEGMGPADRPRDRNEPQ